MSKFAIEVSTQNPLPFPCSMQGIRIPVPGTCTGYPLYSTLPGTRYRYWPKVDNRSRYGYYTDDPQPNQLWDKYGTYVNLRVKFVLWEIIIGSSEDCEEQICYPYR